MKSVHPLFDKTGRPVGDVSRVFAEIRDKFFDLADRAADQRSGDQRAERDKKDQDKRSREFSRYFQFRRFVDERLKKQRYEPRDNERKHQMKGDVQYRPHNDKDHYRVTEQHKMALKTVLRHIDRPFRGL